MNKYSSNRHLVLIIIIALLSQLLIYSEGGIDVGIYRVTMKIGMYIYNTTPTDYKVNIPVYHQIGIPDSMLHFSPFIWLKYNIWYSMNLINDTPVILLGQDKHYLMLVVFKGINETHASFYVYLLDPANNRITASYDLSKYGIIVPKILYNNYRIQYHLYRLNVRQAVLSIYMFDGGKRQGEIVVIDPFKSNPVVNKRIIKGLIFYKYFEDKGYSLCINTINTTSLEIIISNDTLLYHNNKSVIINTELDSTDLIPIFISSIMNNDTLYVYIPYYKYIGLMYNVSLFIITLKTDPSLLLLNKTLVNIGTLGDVSKYTKIYYYTDKIIIPFISGVLMYDPFTNYSKFYVFNANYTDNYSIVIPIGDIVSLIKTECINNTYYGGLPVFLRLYNLEQFNHSYTDIKLNPPRDKLFDTSSIIIDYLSNKTISVMVPYYRLNNDDTLDIGLVIMIIDLENNKILEEEEIHLDNIDLILIPQLWTTFEIETYLYDINNDGFNDYIIVLSYYLLNNTAIEKIYIVSPITEQLIKALPEPMIAPLVLLVLIIFIYSVNMLYKPRKIKRI